MQVQFYKSLPTLNISFDAIAHRLNFNFPNGDQFSDNEMETCQIIMKYLDNNCSTLMAEPINKIMFANIKYLAKQAIMQAYQQTGIEFLLKDNLYV